MKRCIWMILVLAAVSLAFTACKCPFAGSDDPGTANVNREAGTPVAATPASTTTAQGAEKLPGNYCPMASTCSDCANINATGTGWCNRCGKGWVKGQAVTDRAEYDKLVGAEKK